MLAPTRKETRWHTYSERSTFHCIFRSDGIAAVHHLHESMTLILVYNAGLDSAMAVEDAPKLALGASDASNK